MKHGSLFSGIGGFDLAAEWMGWENVFHCEWNPFGQKVLKHYWPNATSYTDITKTDFSIHRGSIDILTGGFPCQPYSVSGNQLGTEDPRHLFPHMLRAVREIKPRWVVGENVRGLVTWNDGLVFEQIQVDLESEGYEVLPFLLPAAGVGADHNRDRIWFVAHNKRESIDGLSNGWRDEKAFSQPSSTARIDNGSLDSEWGNRTRYFGQRTTQPPVCVPTDGVSFGLDGIAFQTWRKESCQAAGNAIVPQVALQIFKAVEAYENLLK